MSEIEKSVVVGINFGSSGCGFAYSFMDEKIIYHMDVIGSDVDKKVPTEIILDDSNYVLHFGPLMQRIFEGKRC